MNSQARKRQRPASAEQDEQPEKVQNDNDNDNYYKVATKSHKLILGAKWYSYDCGIY
jgi:hypothetical protein